MTDCDEHGPHLLYARSWILFLTITGKCLIKVWPLLRIKVKITPTSHAMSPHMHGVLGSDPLWNLCIYAPVYSVMTR